ncbi:MAG: DedA family protein [Ktedonobacterales bacterium]
MTNLVNHLIQILGSVPAILVYLIAAVWMGLESAGIGVPIEPMMLFVGSLAAGMHPHISLPLAILSATVGCLVFSSLAYVIGERVGTTAIARAGRYAGLNQERADHIELWLRHRGAIGVFIARETPMVRTYGSFVMGAARIPLRTFLIATFLGSLLYTAIFITLGEVLGANYRAPLSWLDSHVGPGAFVIVIGIVVALLVLYHFGARLARYRLALHYRRHHAADRLPVTTPATQG